MSCNTFAPEAGYPQHRDRVSFLRIGRNWSILAGYDMRGYAIRLQQCTDEREPMVRAGCKYLTLKEARKHWVSAGRNDTISRRRTAAQVLMLIGLAVEAAKYNGLIDGKVRFNTTPRKAS
ncbi:hypothetical protein [Rhodopseudomonas pseudopalustris]|uniref:Uncharacterized protein n=1 Tax=Rhodopseudomonas pseudopalustris TaxID=1513892 RepID=A0A1H8WJ20_9BRAD|nr:hypothetical protein [Rhodopseudomonas pseudopalustris]SEP27078.1 hypothetical protein SAMN05444123_11297 [Rhodopseudomonas pseudopalustris]